jgi:hypothetical protein
MDERTEREEVEAVFFSLTGGELENEAWVATDDEGREWTFHYWQAFPPEWAESYFESGPSYRTVMRDNMFGMPPEKLGQWKRVAYYASSGEVEEIGEDGQGTGEYIYLGDGWGEIVYRLEEKEVVKATPDEAGCWIDGHWGQYGPARLVQLAIAYGWDDEEASELATKHLASMGPSDDEGLTDDEYEALVGHGGAADDAEDFLNESVAPDGYLFGWHDGEFFLWSNEDWEVED